MKNIYLVISNGNPEISWVEKISYLTKFCLFYKARKLSKRYYFINHGKRISAKIAIASTKDEWSINPTNGYVCNPANGWLICQE